YASATPLKGLLRREGKLADGGTWRRWTAKDVAKLVPEPAMPGYSEMLAYVHVSTYRTWDDVGRFYWGLVKDQLRVTDDIRAAAQEAVKAIPQSDELARIRAVYDFVVSRTRYVGLEFGINSFKPYPVATIAARKCWWSSQEEGRNSSARRTPCPPTISTRPTSRRSCCPTGARPCK